MKGRDVTQVTACSVRYTCMVDLLFYIYLLALTERGEWVRTINTLMSHGLNPRQIVEFIGQSQD